MAEVHPIKGSSIVLTYTGCTVVRPGGKGCVIKEGTIKTGALSSVSNEMSIVFSPPASGIFTEITIENCTVAALNGTFPVKGTLAAVLSGATREVTEAASTGTLSFAGQKAGLERVETLRKKEGSPLVATTAPFLAD